MRTILTSLLFLTCFIINLPSAAAQLTTTCSAADYGAVGDGVTDDRPALQAALDNCTVVNVPPGQYLVSQTPWRSYDLHISVGKTLIGAGRDATTLIQAPNQGPSVRLLHIDGADVTVSDLSLDGNKANQTVDEHRSGVFAIQAPRLTLRRIDSYNFTGDGFYLYRGSNDPFIEDVLAKSNDRDGIAFGGATAGGFILNSTFIGNAAQQIDSEPGTYNVVNGLTLIGNVIDTGGVSNDYVLTISGGGKADASRSHGWTVVGNVINGATFVVWADGNLIANNTGVNPSTKSCYTVYRRSIGNTISGNTCVQTQTSTSGSVAGISVFGTSVTDTPETTIIIGNNITVTGHAKSFGVWVQGAVSVYIANNVFVGPALSAPYYAGIYLRASLPGRGFKIAVVKNNIITNWGYSALRVAGNTTPDGPALFEYLEYTDNIMTDDSNPATQVKAIVIDSNAVPLYQVRTGNTCSGGTSCNGANLP